MEAKKEIVKIIQKMSRKYSPDMIFSDWVECSALAFQNCCQMIHNKTWEQREEQYKNVMKRYTQEEQAKLVYMLELLEYALREDIRDVLGEIYMESGCGSKITGQFFTPFHLSVLTAEMSLPDIIPENEKIMLNEPSVGGGGMIIAAAKALKNRGINYQKIMRVTAQDLDWRSVHMAYVQFSLLGINAEVVQGDTLSDPYIPGNYPEYRVLRTPARMGVLL